MFGNFHLPSHPHERLCTFCTQFQLLSQIEPKTSQIYVLINLEQRHYTESSVGNLRFHTTERQSL
jgi:hypothetical protein